MDSFMCGLTEDREGLSSDPLYVVLYHSPGRGNPLVCFGLVHVYMAMLKYLRCVVGKCVSI